MGPAKGPKQRERADEEEYEQEHLVVHKESSWLEMGRKDRFLLRRKHKDRREGQSSG
jgi:hypothetical protein